MPIAGPILVMLTGVLWGTTGTSLALSAHSGSALGFGAARSTLAGVVLLALALWRPGPAAFVRAWRSRPQRVALLLGAVFMAVYQLSFFVATTHTGVVVGTLTAIGSAPLIAGLIGIVTGTRPTRSWALATAVGLAGLALLIGGGGGAGDGARVNLLGVLAGVAAGAGYAAYAVCSRRVLDAGTPPQVVLAVFFAGAALIVAPLALPEAVRWVADPAGALTVGYVGLVATVLPYLMWIRGMATTAPALATTLNLTEPLTATVLGALVLHEAFTAPVAIGAALIAVGLLVALRAAPTETAAPSNATAPTGAAEPAAGTGTPAAGQGAAGGERHGVSGASPGPSGGRR
ncbi:DMT family transporter [Rhizomonospora bruguierae]|uniref:DMT family transporter n=1 Tax=Rhizomonospora bruguierae TaxID=1581705 RepID=UPI001BCADFDF|nr:DMT family transporter [Micromonospora sp. NBRC 107566]